MKTTLSFSCFLFILFFTLTIHYSIAEEVDCSKYLCDSLFNYVKAGKPYHFGPERRGDVVLDGVPNNGIEETCPRFGLILRENDIGDYFTFNPIVPNDAGLVPLQTPFAIASAGKLACNDTGILRMTHRDDRFQFWHVTVDGEFNTASSCFEFIKYEGVSLRLGPVYTLQNCPYKCGEGSGKCYQVGKLSVSNNYFLTTEDNPVPLPFSLRSLELDYKLVSN